MRNKITNRFISKPDLVILTGCIIFLIVVAGSAGKRGRELGKRMICAGNIKAQLEGFILYANNYEGKVFGDFGWLDGSDRWKYRTLMDLMGMNTNGSIVEHPWTYSCSQKDISAPSVFYCPSNIGKNLTRQQQWDYDIRSCYRESFRLMAYQWILDEDEGYGHKIRNQSMIDDNKIFPTRLDIIQSADAELITDLSASSPDESKGLIFDSYGGGGGGGGGGQGMLESSNHIKNSHALYGINVGFCDGHVAWRPFSEMKKRWRWGSGGPRWWW